MCARPRPNVSPSATNNLSPVALPSFIGSGIGSGLKTSGQSIWSASQEEQGLNHTNTFSPPSSSRPLFSGQGQQPRGPASANSPWTPLSHLPRSPMASSGHIRAASRVIQPQQQQQQQYPQAQYTTNHLPPQNMLSSSHFQEYTQPHHSSLHSSAGNYDPSALPLSQQGFLPTASAANLSYGFGTGLTGAGTGLEISRHHHHYSNAGVSQHHINSMALPPAPAMSSIWGRDG